MNHKDDLELNNDLESNYKAASNESPSLEMDQLIQNAAAQALADETSEADTSESMQSNVIKGRFAWRKWQTPVSIAAVAVITFSFVNNYVDNQDPIAEFEADSMMPANSPIANKSKPEAAMPSLSSHGTASLGSVKNDVSKKVTSLPFKSQVMELSTSRQVNADNEMKEKRKSLNRNQLKQRREKEFTAAVEENFKDNIEEEIISAEDYLVLAEPLTKAQSIDGFSTISNDIWLNRIEQHLKKAELEKAKIALEEMLEAQSDEAFTESQKTRLKEIKTTLGID